MAGYLSAMSKPYGVTLDRAWTEWAAERGVPPTVAAALLLISERRPAHEVVPKLAADEFKVVIDIVRRSPNHFASGTLAALESQRHAAGTPTEAASDQAAAGIEPGAGGTRRTWLDSVRARARQAPPRPEPASAAEPQRAATTEKAGTLAGTLAETARRRLIVEDLMKAGLSVRMISGATDIPRSSVHRAMRAAARAEAKREIAILEIANELLGKRLPTGAAGEP